MPMTRADNGEGAGGQDATALWIPTRQRRTIRRRIMSANDRPNDIDLELESVEAKQLLILNSLGLFGSDLVTNLGELKSGQPKTVHPMVLETLIPDTTLSPDSQDRCTICLDLLANNTRVKKIPLCSHSFHSKCLKDWMAVNECCPNCKVNLALADLLSNLETQEKSKNVEQSTLNEEKSNSKDVEGTNVEAYDREPLPTLNHDVPLPSDRSHLSTTSKPSEQPANKEPGKKP